MIEQVWIVIVVQLVISLYLAWKVTRLSTEAEMMQVIVGSMLMEMEKAEVSNFGTRTKTKSE